MIAIDPHRCTTRKENCDLAQYKRLLSTDTPRFYHNSFLSFPSLFISTHTANAETLNRFNPAPLQAEYKTDQFLGATVFSRDGILLVRHQLVDRLLCIHTSHPPLPPSLPPSLYRSVHQSGFHLVHTTLIYHLRTISQQSPMPCRRAAATIPTEN